MDISVIIPTWNEEGYIEDCLKSISSQNINADYEIIVCDAKSDDRTVDIAKKYADRIVLSDRKSIGIQRNLGAKYAEGRYLVFIDADTILPENYLEKVMEKFETYKELLAFSARFIFSKRDEKLVFTERITNSYLEFRDKVGSPILLGFNTCVRRDAFESIGGFKDVPLEDGEFGFRMRRYGKTRYFTDFYVITSSRRLDEMGLLGTLRYYFEMDLATRNRSIGKLLIYNEYIPCRVDNKILQKEFSKIFSPNIPPMDMKIRDYIKKKSGELLSMYGAYKTTTEQFLEKVIDVSKSVAELKLIKRVNKKDVDRAIKLIRERMEL